MQLFVSYITIVKIYFNFIFFLTLQESFLHAFNDPDGMAAMVHHFFSIPRPKDVGVSNPLLFVFLFRLREVYIIFKTDRACNAWCNF